MPDMDHTALPTVHDVLALPEVAAGSPELLAGERGLGREVRWAHVAAGAVAGLLDGSELVLTTGAGWPQASGAFAPVVTELVTAGGSGVSAIVWELGHTFSEVPDALVRACEHRGIPLVALHREVRFVQITQRVHQRILAGQHEALEARAAVHAMLTELGLNRSPADYVVERLADTVGAPVVLEDTLHRVVAIAAHGRDPVQLLAPWHEAAGRDPLLPDGAVCVPVEARGTRWGRLTAMPGAAHAAGPRTVLELGAFALALGRLADAEGDQWLELGSKRLFDALLGGRFRSDAELAAQLAAAGLRIDGRVVLAVTLRGTGDFGGHDSLERATLETALRRAVAPEGRVLIAPDTPDRSRHTGLSQPETALLALVSFPPGDARAQARADHGPPPLAARLARELEMLVPGTTPAAWRAHLALGAPGLRLRQLIASLEQLRAAGRLPAVHEYGRVSVQQVELQPLAHLVRALAGLPELQEFSTDMLGPLLAHDGELGPGHTGDLVRVLAAYTAHPTNRSLAARRARLSRSVFYQRLTLIEELLGVDLANGETIAALQVALLARAPGATGRG